MLAHIKSNIEARYVSRGPGVTDLELAQSEGVISRAIYLNNGQHYVCAPQQKKIILHLFQGVAALILQGAGQEEHEQLLKGDIIVLPPLTGYSVKNQTSTVVILSEMLID